eukprot:403350888
MSKQQPAPTQNNLKSNQPVNDLQLQQQLILQQQQQQFQSLILDKCDSRVIAEEIIFKHILAGVDQYFYDQYLESKKSEFANWSIVMLAIKAAEFQFIIRDKGEHIYKKQEVEHLWLDEEEPAAASFDTSTMEELKLKVNLKLVDTTLDAINDRDFSISGSSNQNKNENLKRGPMSIRSNNLRDILGRKLLRNIQEKVIDYQKMQVALEQSQKDKDQQKELDDIDFKVIKLRTKVEMDEKHKKDQLLKKKSLQDQMKQKNMELQMRITQDSPSKKVNKNDGSLSDNEEEHGIYNQLVLKNQSVTFDYRGNIIIVKNPKLQGNRTIVGPQYQVMQNSNGDKLDLNEDGKQSKNKKRQPNSTARGDFNQDYQDEIGEGNNNDERKSSDQSQGGNKENGTIKAYYGHIIQALYSQPHKMLELRPGVMLNEGGKQYGGGAQGAYQKGDNQIDLQSYKKSREKDISSSRGGGGQSSEKYMSRMRTGAGQNNNNNMFDGSFDNRGGNVNISELMKSNGLLSNHQQSKSQLYNNSQDNIGGGGYNDFLNNSSTLLINENGVLNQSAFSINPMFNNSTTMDYRSQIFMENNDKNNGQQHLMMRKNMNRLTRGTIDKGSEEFYNNDTQQQQLSSINNNQNVSFDDRNNYLSSISMIDQRQQIISSSNNPYNQTTFTQKQPQITSTKNIIKSILASAKDEISNTSNYLKSHLPDQKQTLGSLMSKKLAFSKRDVGNSTMIQLPQINDFNTSKSQIRVYKNDDERQFEMQSMQSYQDKFNQFNRSRHQAGGGNTGMGFGYGNSNAQTSNKSSNIISNVMGAGFSTARRQQQGVSTDRSMQATVYGGNLPAQKSVRIRTKQLIQ